MNQSTKGVYIPSIEASQIWSCVNRGTRINLDDKDGMFPYSLTLLKLRSTKGYKEVPTNTGQWESDDIINVKFKYSVQDSDKTLEHFKNKLNEKKQSLKDTEKSLLSADPKQIKKLLKKKQGHEDSVKYFEEMISKLKRELKDEKLKANWEYVKVEDIRKSLYADTGFKLSNKKTYKVWQRTTSKSRKGEVTFINAKLYDEISSWSRMNIEFPTDKVIDLAGLAAYSSLTSSGIIDLLQIDPKHIVLIDDIESHFKHDVNVVRFDSTNSLKSKAEDNYGVSNILTDGQILLSDEYFEDGKSYYQLRQHFYKGAAFKCFISKWLEDNKPEGKTLDTWLIKNKYEDGPVKASDIKMIVPLSVFKGSKFGYLLTDSKDETEQIKAAWRYWKDLIANEGDENGAFFGICKKDKPTTKHGKNVHRTSYQIFNTLEMTDEEFESLTKWQVDYIDALKDKKDNTAFFEYARRKANDRNRNDMMIDLAEHNIDFVKTEMFCEFRNSLISEYVQEVKSGKVYFKNADYCTVVMNPEMMLHAAVNNEFDLNNAKLTGWKVYSKMFEDGDKIAAFRSPHNSPSNILLLENRLDEFYDTYFDLSPNVLVISGVDRPIQARANGHDQDGDTFLLFGKNETMIKLASDAQKYRVPVLDVESKPNQYKLNSDDLAKLDNAASDSQKLVGICTNKCQLLWSVYLHDKSNGHINEDLLAKIDNLVVLSTVAIDKPKKDMGINVMREISKCTRGLQLKEIWVNKQGDEVDGNDKHKKVKAYPMFFEDLGEKSKKEDEVEGKRKKYYSSYNVPVDMLINKLETNRAEKTKKYIGVYGLLNKELKKTKYHYNQYNEIVSSIIETADSISSVWSNENTTTETEAYNRIGRLTENLNAKLKKKKLNRGAMYRGVAGLSSRNSKGAAEERDKSNTTAIWKNLHKYDRDLFLECFVKKVSEK